MSHHPERTARNVRPVNQPPSFYFVSVSKDFSGWLNKRVDTSKFRKEYHFEFKNPLAR